MERLFKVMSLLLLVVTLLSTSLTAQKNTLDYHFKDYEIATFDSKSLRSHAENRRNDFINLPFNLSKKYQFDLELTTEKAFGDDYIRKSGSQLRSGKDLKLPMVLRGYAQKSNDIRAVITVNDNFLYGQIRSSKEIIYFEPLSTFDPNAKPNQIVIYKASDVIPRENGTCAAHESQKKSDQISLQKLKESSSNRFAGECLQVDLAVANDHTMFNHYGSNSAVSNFNAGVMANVNTDYDDAFNDEIRFVIVETYIAQNSSQNVWGATSDINALLDNFTAWAPNGFSTTHDLGQLWSRTNLSGSTIGLAWVGTVCSNSYRYHVLEDYGGNANGLRNLVSHEIGHNFNQSHDSGSGFIMSSSVNGTTTWSPGSISGINSYYAGLSCLSNCSGNPPGGGGNPPVANFDASFISECNPTRVQFNDLSTNNPTSWSWQFESGSPSSSSQQNPQVDFPGAGSYRVTLTATNSDGSDSQILNMNLNGIGSPPDASFTSSTNGFIVNFTNNSTNATSYNWNFGDGNTSTSTNPSHTYSNAGSFTVTLTANNDCGSDQYTFVVTIVDQVTAGFSANTTTSCEGESISFTNESSANATSFFWEFENGTPATSSAENPTVVFNNAGTFNVRLTASGGGDTDVENKVNYISINDVPSASFTSNITGSTVSFINNTSNGDTHSWSFGDGNSSNASSPNHTYAGAGTYNVTLTASNECGSNQYVGEIVIADEVVADFSVSSNEGCSGEVFQMTNLSTGNVTSYFWEFQDGVPATSTEANPSVTFSSPGAKDVRLTVSNAQFSDQLIRDNYITIGGPPQVSFTTEITDNTVVFDNNTILGWTYLWDFGDGQTSTQINPTHTYDSPGEYTVTLTSENDCESASSSSTINLEADVVASFTSSSQESCQGESISFTNTSVGDINSYFWEFEGGTPSTSTEENPSVLYNNAGSFNVKLTVTGDNASDTEDNRNFISINSAPNAGFSNAVDGYSVVMSNASTGADSYFWDFGDGETSSSTDPSHTYSDPGTYTINLVATNDCGQDEFTQVVVIEEVLIANFNYENGVCAGGEISFINTSEGSISDYFWEFEGGTPATSTEENPIVTYSQAGSFNVVLTVNSSFGGSDTKTVSNAVVIQETAIADFSYELNEFTVSFTNASENYSSVEWDFGDGGSSTQTNPSHTFSEEGDYNVVLTVTGDCGSESIEMLIPVYDQLLANFMATETTLCPGDEIELIDLSAGNPTQWEWTIEGEEVIVLDEQNPTLTLAEPGNYTVELVVTNEEEEDSKVIQQYIEVMPMVEALFEYEQTELSVAFINSSENGNEFIWDFGDGTVSTESDPVHSFTEEGDYLVKLLVTNDCGEEAYEQVLSIYERLVVNFNTATTDICTNSEVQFSNRSSGNATEYKWTFPGGSPSESTEKEPMVTYSEPGLYDVILTVKSENEEVTETKSRFISVDKATKADFKFEVDKNVVQFTDLSQDADLIQWSFGGSDENPTIEYDEEAVYEVTLSTSNGCSEDAITKEIDLAAEANTYVNISIENENYCLGQEIQFIDLSSNDITEWNWKFPGGMPSESSEENPKVIYSDLGTYDVELTVTNGFNVKTIKLEDYVSILDQAVAEFSIEQEDNQIFIEDLSDSYRELSWYINGEKYQGSLETYTFDENGTYIIQQIASNACSESIFKDTVLVDVFPSAGFSLDINRGCAPLTVNFESRSTDNTSEVTWLLMGADQEEVVGQNPKVTYDLPGNYDISVVATNAFGSDTITLTNIIEVTDDPVVSFDYETNGQSVSFETVAERYEMVEWDFGDGSFSDEINVEHKYEQEGNYIVTLTVYYGNCESTYTEEIALFSSSVNDISDEESIILYPNPADQFVKIDFSQMEGVKQLFIMDQVGRRLVNLDIEQGQSEVIVSEISNLIPGHYHVGIISDKQKPLLKKLIVVR